MDRLTNPEEFKKYSSSLKVKKTADTRRIRVCLAGCRAFGANELYLALQNEVKNKNLWQEIEIMGTGCHGFCARGPVASIDPFGWFYQKLSPSDAPAIIKSVAEAKADERFIYSELATGQKIANQSDIPFYKNQTKLVLRNCGQIDPMNIDNYIENQGYDALVKAITEMKPEQVLETVKKSGLRGRGGVGFPTGLKWAFTRGAADKQKYLVCNAEEGEPGTFKDVTILEGDPNSVLEGMIIAGYAIGAQKGFIYLQAEYPGAIRTFGNAIKQAYGLGFLGENILGSGFGFDVELVVSAGGYVCGEETAQLEAIEGRRAMPRPRPPFPAVKGLWAKPTNINNVETYASVPQIILKGADFYTSLGSEKSKGTKILCLAGKLNNPGIIELPMGTKLEKVLYEYGGGMLNGKKFKAIMSGGPSGGYIPEKYLDLPIDYEGFVSIGSMMGSGALLVLDQETCIVEMTYIFMKFLEKESCGKCVPCSRGVPAMVKILERIVSGRGKKGDPEFLEDLGTHIAKTALCGLGQAAPNPVFSALRHFRQEFIDHIEKNECKAGVCRIMDKKIHANVN